MEKLAFIFAGQGAQQPGMGRELASCRAGRETLATLRAQMGETFPESIWEGSADELKRTAVAQPALFWQGYTLARLLSDAGFKPVASCGLSLGEYTALAAAGGLAFEAGLALVKHRGALMSAAVAAQGGGMFALQYGDRAALEKCLDGFNQAAATEDKVYISNLNCPGQIVIAGRKERLEALRPLLSELGAARIIPLAVEGAFHTPLLAAAAQEFKRLLDQQSFGPTAWPVYSNWHAAAPQPQDWPQVLYEQMCSSVRLEDCLRRLLADGVEHFIEIGPGNVLSGCLRKIDRGIKCSRVQTLDDALTLAAAYGLTIEV